MMRHAGASPFRWRDDPNSDPPGALTFDQAGTFELRYLRHRRSSETQGPIPYSGEFDRELGRMKK